MLVHDINMVIIVVLLDREFQNGTAKSSKVQMLGSFCPNTVFSKLMFLRKPPNDLLMPKQENHWFLPIHPMK